MEACQVVPEELNHAELAASEFPADEFNMDEFGLEDSGEWTAFESLFSPAKEEDGYAALQALRADNDLLADEPGSNFAMSDFTNPQLVKPDPARPARRTLQWLKRNVSSFRITVSLQRPAVRTHRDQC